MKQRLLLILLVSLLACESEPEAPVEVTSARETGPEEVVEEEAPVVAVQEPEEELPLLGIDTHIDTPQRMLDRGDDFGAHLEGGHVDRPRMVEGGLGGAFFSVFVNPSRFQEERAWERALALTRVIREYAEGSEDAVLCESGDDVRRAFRDGKTAVLMGVEGAQAIGSDDPATVLRRVRELYRLGNRYMTITWSTDNMLGHSSLGENPEGGLTPLGRRVVRLMNELGMIVDVSHVSDQTFWDIMDVTRKPVLASHSSLRSLADIPRNMTDAMVRWVAAGGGAVCINFFTQFLDREYRLRRRRLAWREREAFRALPEGHWVDEGRAAFELAQRLDPNLNPPSVDTIVRHIARTVELGGAGAACLGSDFDGVSELPVGMRDVRDLGVLREALEERELPVRETFYGNVLRVLDAQTAASGESDDSSRSSTEGVNP